MNETVLTTIMITGFGIAFLCGDPDALAPTGFKFIIGLCNSKRRTMNAVWREELVAVRRITWLHFEPPTRHAAETLMGSLKKRRKAKISKHKRRKRMRENRHKKRLRYKA